MTRWNRCAVTVLVMALLLALVCPSVPVFAEETAAGTSPETTESSHPEETAEETTEETTVPVPRDENGLTARQAVVYDSATGQILFSKEISTGKVFPASITKLFSAFVALQYLSPDQVVTAGEELEEVAPDSSVAYILQEQSLTVAMLVEGMLLPSGNDASYILATAAGRKIAADPELEYHQAVQVFVDEMNRTARDLGLDGSHFMNPDGYHMGSHYTSLPDLVTIARLALDNPVISHYVHLCRDSVVYASGQSNTWHNTNQILDPESEYYRADACGLKTGYTDAAGNCLLSAFRKGESSLIIGVFGCPHQENRFQDTLLLADRFG